MKNHQFTLLFLALLASGPLCGQITLEHVYPYRRVTRHWVSGLGERYLAGVYANTAATVYWFDGYHAPVGTVSIQTDPPIFIFEVREPSAGFFDDDPGIEVLIYGLDTTVSSMFCCQVFDDDGTPLSPCFPDQPKLVTTVSGERLLLAGNRLYAVPGFSLVKEFTDARSDLFYVRLDDGTGLYGYVDENGDLVHLNDDFTVHSVLAGPDFVQQGGYLEVHWYGQNLLNPDAEIEWAYKCIDQGKHYARFFTGSTMTVEYGGVFNHSVGDLQAWPGMGFTAPASFKITDRENDSTLFFQPLAGTLELAVPGWWKGHDDATAGALLARYIVPPQDAVIPVLQSDYSVWKTFPKDTSRQFRVNEVSSTLFDTDPASGELFGFYDDLSVGLSWRVFQENGAIQFQDDDAKNATVSRIAGLNNKLLMHGYYSGQGNQTRVYSLPSATPTSTQAPAGPAAALALAAMPNPTDGVTRLDLTAFDGTAATITVFDALGRVAYREHLQAAPARFELDLAGWPRGLYSVEVVGSKGRAVGKVVKW